MILKNLTNNLHTEISSSELPKWIEFFINLGSILSKKNQEKLLIGISAPTADFCSLFIAAGANLAALEERGKFGQENNKEITFETLDPGESYKVYVDKKKKWEEITFKRKYKNTEGRTIAHFFKVKGGVKEARIFKEDFEEKVKNASYGPDQLEMPDILRAIFPKLDLTWYLNENLSSSAISNTSIYGIKSHILEDTRNTIFYKREDGTMIAGVLANLCKIVTNQNRSFGTFTRVISSQKSDHLNKMNREINSKIKIFSESAFSKLNANKQAEQIRIVIFDKSRKYEILNDARDKFIQETKNFKPLKALDLIEKIPDSISLSIHMG